MDQPIGYVLRHPDDAIAIPSPFPILLRIHLHFARTRVIHVLTAVITAKGEYMNTSTTEETGTTAATGTGEQPKPTKKARVAPRKPNVAPAKAKSAHKATKGKPGKRAAKQPPKGRQKPAPAREGTKTAKVLALLKRPGGATAKELMKATGWQAHSVRGFLSGTLGKKMGLAVESTKREDGERQYKIAR